MGGQVLASHRSRHGGGGAAKIKKGYVERKGKVAGKAKSKPKPKPSGALDRKLAAVSKKVLGGRPVPTDLRALWQEVGDEVVFSGYRGKSGRSPVLRYSLGANAWSMGKPAPGSHVQRVGAVALDRARLLVFGGEDHDYDQTRQRHIYDVAKDKWKPAAPSPRDLFAPTGAGGCTTTQVQHLVPFSCNGRGIARRA